MKKEAKQLKDSYSIQAKMQYKWKPVTENMSVYIRIYFWDRRIRDWDNWHKLSMDSLTGIVYEDDSQIKLATIDIVEWFDKKNPRIDLIFEELWI